MRPAVMTLVILTKHLPDERREHVEARLQRNLMAWLTTFPAAQVRNSTLAG